MDIEPTDGLSNPVIWLYSDSVSIYTFTWCYIYHTTQNSPEAPKAQITMHNFSCQNKLKQKSRAMAKINVVITPF